jgi:IPT/TIG domain-containing protein
MTGFEKWKAPSAVVALGLWLTLTFASCGGGGSGRSIPPPPPFFDIAVAPSTTSIAPGTSATVQVSILPVLGFTGTVSMTVAGLPTGLTASPSSFTLQTAAQSVTLTAAPSMTTGNYSFTFNGTSGSISNSTTENVGIGPVQGFYIAQPESLEVVAILGSATAVPPLQTKVCCAPGPDNYSINFSAEGLPAGVTASFSPNPITAGDFTTLTLTSPANGHWIQNIPMNVVATPTASAPTENLALDLVVAPPPGNLPQNRSDYLRTDDTPQSIVYDAALGLIFSSDFVLNRVDVVSTTTRQLVKSIPVMRPVGLALSLDGSEVLVGGDAQQIVAISTSSLQVVQLWKLPRLSGNPVEPLRLYPLSNGQVAVQWLEVGGGAEQLAIWNPTTNSLAAVIIPGRFGDELCYFSSNAAGTMVLIADCTNSTVNVYDVASGTFTSQISFPSGDYIYGVAASPDGSRFIIFEDVNGINIYNNQFQLIGPVPGVGVVSGFIFSADSSRIYLTATDNLPVIFVSDGSTGALINTAPALGTVPPDGDISPYPVVETPFAIDSTGIIYGSADHGIAFDDSTYSINYALGFNATPLFASSSAPTFGPLNSATAVTFNPGVGFGFLPDVWFGGVRGTGAALSQAGTLTVNTPPSAQAGPVNIKVIQPDGTPIFNPLAFSYGPAPLFVNGDTSTPNGGATSDIIAVGLPTEASQIQVTVGGKGANIISAKLADIENPYFPDSYPYPAVDVKVTLPPGNGDQDLQVTTSAGSATLTNAIHYVQSVTDYKSTDTFQAILLDRKRSQLYLSAGDHIDVFSLKTQQFLAPFTPPSLGGQKAFHGMALTPDGSELLATNFADGSVALINPDQPSTATAVQIIPSGMLGNLEPDNIVTTDNGTAFVEPISLSGTGALFELDLSSLQVTSISIHSFSLGEVYPLAASGDGSKLLINGEGVAIYDVASNTWSTNIWVGVDNAAVSFNGSAFVAGNVLVDASADVSGYLAFQDVYGYEVTVPFSLPLEKVPDGGSLIYIPYPGWVDMFDVNHGAMLHRLMLTEQVQQVTDAMVIDAYGDSIYLITNAGLTIVQLNGAPLAIGSISPSTGPAGTDVTIYGSGFRQGTTVTANGSAATATFVDPNTLQATIPSVTAGSVQIIVTNPGGVAYSLDNAFTVQ